MSGFAAGSTRPVGVDRRTFLRRAGITAAGVAGTRLVAPTWARAQDATVKADPAVKRGGTLRFGVNSAPAHFDVHQSGTVGNVGTQGPMYDCLIRRSPRDGQTIVPDDPPLLPIAYEKIYDAWHNRVRGQNPATFFGIYDVVRWDTVSISS